MTNREAFRVIIRTIIIGILWLVAWRYESGAYLILIMLFIYFVVKIIDLKLFGEW
jgi:hypothetical protein